MGCELQPDAAASGPFRSRNARTKFGIVQVNNVHDMVVPTEWASKPSTAQLHHHLGFDTLYDFSVF